MGPAWAVYSFHCLANWKGDEPMNDTRAPREWWIKNGMAYEYEPDAGSWSFHVVERKALDAALATLESFRKINDDDAHAIYLLTKERDEALAENAELKLMMRGWNQHVLPGECDSIDSIKKCWDDLEHRAAQADELKAEVERLKCNKQE